MKQSTVLLIALTPFACWGATAEEEALQQQLDQLRQQLIQQNQALHQLQARLEAVKATGTTAVAAEGLPPRPLPNLTRLAGPPKSVAVPKT
ncbi:hypothetical protein ACSZMQ_15320 [Aeromonas rivipollensis]